MILAGKVVIVTGAAGNLGSACAREEFSQTYCRLKLSVRKAASSRTQAPAMRPQVAKTALYAESSHLLRAGAR